MILSHHHDTIPPSPRYSDFSHDKENHQSFPSPSQSINPHQQKSSTALGNTRSRADKPVSSSLRPFLRSSSRRGPVASPYDRPPEGATKSKASIRHKNRRKGHLPAIKCDGPDDDQSLEPTSSPSVARSTGPVVYSKSSALLPLSLPRPDRMAFIDVASVEGMEGIPFTYVQERLAVEGPNLLQSALSARLNHPAGQTLLPPLPDTLDFTFGPASTPSAFIPYTSSSNFPPNYCLAVRKTPPYSTADMTDPASAGTILPIHDLIYRTNCAHLPHISPRDPSLASESLPLIHITLPSPPTLPILNTYLYTQRTDILLSSLISVPSGLGFPTPTSRSGLTHVLADQLDIRNLMERIAKIHGVWSNVCSLGIADPNLWRGLDTAWEVVLGAIAIVQIRNGTQKRD